MSENQNDPKITINAVTETASEQVLAKANQETSCVDARGRKIVLKKPQVLAQYRLVEMLGDAASNPAYMNMVMPLIFVSAIDDKPIFLPTKKLQLEALIQELDEDGIEAVMNGVREHFGAPNPDQDKEDLKK